jgi:ABC-type dipeptide/oligopeptide/nickel transport system permease component
MATYTLRRLIQAIPIVIGISILSFLIVYLTPGSPVDKFRSPRVSPEAIAALIRSYGLDQPLPIQFSSWFTKFWASRGINTPGATPSSTGAPSATRSSRVIPSTLC